MFLDDPKSLAQAEMLANRLRKQARHLRKWARREDVTCYRLYDRDIPEIALSIDLYEGWLHIAENKRHRSRDDSEEQAWLATMANAASAALEIGPERIVTKSRDDRGGTTAPRVNRPPVELVGREGGLRFLINLTDYWDTGLFLDHRSTRAMVRAEAQGKHFLNLFAYTGAFSVYAAAGGALTTMTVDLSKRYLAWAEKNLALNGFAGPAHRTLAADILDFLDRGPRNSLRYDLVVLDPPTFSNSKKMTKTFTIQEDYVNLINRALAFTAPGGVLYFSNNFRAFKFDSELIHAESIHEITQRTRPPDFRDEKIHRCWRIVKT